MIDQDNTYLPPAPQSGRAPGATDPDDDQSGLWSQIMAVFRDIGGSFDAFANDANPEVRALGRVARQRRPPSSDDYFALGDLCARLTLNKNHLNEAYLAKTFAAYTQAAELDRAERRPARVALQTFAQWVVDIARTLGSYDALKAAMLACERIQQLDLLANKPEDRARWNETEQRLREQLTRQANAQTQVASGSSTEGQILCDQGQMLLRQSQPEEAFALFERAIALNSRSHAAWLWRAMALTDMGRFNDALASYDRALEIEPDNARVWNSKGALLTELGRAEAALECLNRALEISNSDAKVKGVFWLNRGKALFILKRYREAREALVRSYQYDPSPESAAGIAACREQLEFVTSSSPVNA
jgi:tetratricopeptide (TPR) repeat protein